MSDLEEYSTLLLWLVLLGITAVSIAWYNGEALRGLPTPSESEWLWGHEKRVYTNEPGRAFRRWFAEVGLVFKMTAAFGAPAILVLADPEGIAHILQKHIYDYHHSDVVRPRVARLLGKGLGWVEGEAEHRRMKRLVGPSLSIENIKAMSSDVRDSAMLVLNNLQSLVERETANVDVNILDWAGKATLNVIGRVAFQHDFEGGNSSDAQQILNGRKKGSSPAARFVGFLTLMLLRRFSILNLLPIPAIQSQGLAKVAIQGGVARDMIRRNERLTAGSVSAEKDLLGRLLLAESEKLITRSELYEQISTFIISGHETTTNALGYTVWELARHPDIQQRLRQELQAFSGEPDYDDFQTKLPYLDAVLREISRLYPGLPYMERVAQKHDIIPLRFPVQLQTGQTVKEIAVYPGQTVLIPIIALHRQDDVWEKPDEFVPERWLNSGNLPSSEKLCSGWSNTLAFSDGPRSCIGMRLAIFQYKVILAGLITRFTFSDPGADISLKIASSLQPWVTDRLEDGPQLPVLVSLV